MEAEGKILEVTRGEYIIRAQLLHDKNEDVIRLKLFDTAICVCYSSDVTQKYLQGQGYNKYYKSIRELMNCFKQQKYSLSATEGPNIRFTMLVCQPHRW